MANIIFSDEIVKLTDLRKKQKQWFEKAYRKPITVPYKDDNLTIMNRAEIGRVLEQMKYITLLIEHWNEIKHKKASKVFPWLEKLDKQEQFREELLESAVRCIEKENWTEFIELLEDWEATSEALGNPELNKALKKKVPTGKYVALDE